jgi:hypothetical protein
MIADLARVDLKLHSEMDDRQFTEFVKQTKANAPWLVGDVDKPIRLRPELAGTPEFQRFATPEEISDGVWFKNAAEYQASRSAA